MYCDARPRVPANAGKLVWEITSAVTVPRMHSVAFRVTTNRLSRYPLEELVRTQVRLSMPKAGLPRDE